VRFRFRLVPVVVAALMLFNAAPGRADDPGAKLGDVKAALGARSTAAADVVAAKQQKETLTLGIRAERADYQSMCPEGYPRERAAACDARYARYTAAYKVYSDAWDAQDARQKDAQGRIDAANAKIRSLVETLSRLFPGCPAGTSDLELQAAYNCLSVAWDGAQHRPAAVDGSGKIVWNDYNPDVKALHNKYLALQPKLDAVNAKLAAQYELPSSSQRNMTISTLKQERSRLESQMNALKSQALSTTSSPSKP